jgi:hypothetical protein
VPSTVVWGCLDTPQAARPIVPYHRRSQSAQAPPVEIGEKCFPGPLGLSRGNGEIDHLLSAIFCYPQGHQHHPLDRSCPGFAFEHHPVEDQKPVLPLNGPAMKGRYRSIQALSHPRDRNCSDYRCKIQNTRDAPSHIGQEDPGFPRCRGCLVRPYPRQPAMTLANFLSTGQLPVSGSSHLSL